MGLFSRKRLTTSSQVMHLVEDTPDIVRQSVINSILGDTDIVTDLGNTILNSLATKVTSYHTYGRDNYTNGLPEGTVGYETIPTDKVQVALDSDRPTSVGKSNGISVVVLGEFSTDKACFDYLSRTNDTWDETTLKWIPVGESSEVTFKSSQLLTPSRVRCNYSFSTASQTYYGKFEFEVADYTFIADEKYYVAEYAIYDLATQTKESKSRYWQYRIASNKYPNMQPDHGTKYSQFMPVVPVRINNEDYTAESREDTDLYKTSKKLLKKIEIDFKQLGDGINASPDIGEVDHAYLVLGVNPRSKKPEVSEYLFSFFSDLEGRSEFSKEAFSNWYDSKVKQGQPPINTLEVRDATYNTLLCWNYIDRIITKGVIGKVGTVTKVINGNNGTETINIGSGGGQNAWVTIENPKNTLILAKQVTETYYTTLVIGGLMFSNRIYGVNKDVISTLASEEGQEIIIPLNLDIINGMPKLAANTLFYDSILLVINAYKWTKLKWYQTGFFKIFTAVIAIAITIVSGGIGSFVGALVGAAGAGVVALAVFIGKVILAGILVKVGFQFVAEHLGLEIALILAAVLTVYGLAGDAFSLPFADSTAFIGTNLNGAITSIAQEQLTELQTESLALTESYEQQLGELKVIQDELAPAFTLDPLGLYTELGMLPYESSSNFITRSIGMPNTSQLTLDAVSSFVDTSLNLKPY